jgi:sugar phosphate isomerase/epimerase
MDNSRGYFIKQTGLGLMGAAIGSSYLSSCNNLNSKGNGPFAQIGLQLYTLRELLAQDSKLTLETIAKIGYSHVETFGLDLDNNTFWGIGINDLQKYLSDNNLKTYSGHYDMSKYLSKDHEDKESIEKYIETAHKLGQKYVIAPVTPMFDLNSLTPDDYQYAAEQLNKAGEMAKKAGIKIGYHNHFWEFRNFANGTKGLDILIAFTEPDLVAFELDIYWAEKSGVNPVSYFNKYPGRFHLWHIKDMDRSYTAPVIGEPWDTMSLDSIFTDQVRFAEVGSGTIDYVSLTSNAETSGLRYAFVEQDEIYLPNKFDSIKRSYDYVQKNLVKTR